MNCDNKVFNIYPGYVTVEYLEVKNAGGLGIYVGGSYTTIKNCIIHDGTYGIYVEYNNHYDTLYNNVIYNMSGSGINVDCGQTYHPPIIANNTVYNCAGAGIRVESGDNIVVNNICIGNHPDYQENFSNALVNHCNYNISGDSSITAVCTGTGNHANVTLAQLGFISTLAGNINLHILSSSVAHDAGQALTGYFTVDLDGNTREGTWDIGADESGNADATMPYSYATPGGKNFSAYPVTVTLSGLHYSHIYYTTDGSEPTASSNIYFSPIIIDEPMMLKFFAVDAYGNQEAVHSEEYFKVMGDNTVYVTLYVSTAGNDQTGIGSRENPFQTINGAYASIPTPVVWPYKISVLPGTYTQAVQLNLNKGFSKSRPLLVSGPLGRCPIVDFPVLSGETNGKTINCSESFVTFERLKIIKSGASQGTGIDIASHDVLVKHCILINDADAQAAIKAHDSKIRAIGCAFSGFTASAMVFDGPSTSLSGVFGWRIVNNTFYNSKMLTVNTNSGNCAFDGLTVANNIVSYDDAFTGSVREIMSIGNNTAPIWIYNSILHNYTDLTQGGVMDGWVNLDNCVTDFDDSQPYFLSLDHTSKDFLMVSGNSKALAHGDYHYYHGSWYSLDDLTGEPLAMLNSVAITTYGQVYWDISAGARQYPFYYSATGVFDYGHSGSVQARYDLSSDGKVSPEYYKTAEGRIDVTGDDPRMLYNLKDHLGNTMVVAELDQSVPASHTVTAVEKNFYYPYGKNVVLYTSSIAKLATERFTKKELDAEGFHDGAVGIHGVGLYYFGRRYYDADIGSWISMDLMSQYFSPYAYCANNPINLTDKDGSVAAVEILVIPMMILGAGLIATNETIKQQQQQKNAAADPNIIVSTEARSIKGPPRPERGAPGSQPSYNPKTDWKNVYKSTLDPFKTDLPNDNGGGDNNKNNNKMIIKILAGTGLALANAGRVIKNYFEEKKAAIEQFKQPVNNKNQQTQEIKAPDK